MLWCGKNHLFLNVSKTKDFRRTRTTTLNTIHLLGEEVEVVENFKYLGVYLDNRLDWKYNTEAIFKKGQSR